MQWINANKLFKFYLKSLYFPHFAHTHKWNLNIFHLIYRKKIYSSKIIPHSPVIKYRKFALMLLQKTHKHSYILLLTRFIHALYTCEKWKKIYIKEKFHLWWCMTRLGEADENKEWEKSQHLAITVTLQCFHEKKMNFSFLLYSSAISSKDEWKERKIKNGSS